MKVEEEKGMGMRRSELRSKGLRGRRSRRWWVKKEEEEGKREESERERKGE